MKCRHKARCLVCGHSDVVLHDSKDDYQEVRVCPKCKGAYVDIWKLQKYMNDTNNQIEIIMNNPNQPPKIKLNDQIIEGIIELQYNYETRDVKSQGKHNFTVKYYDKESSVTRTVSANRTVEG
ncbi:hypothetical protein [Lysinibacillus sphaericus]|uniref:hypothetical protein n=1 Tax=Lysinibacillus sphaericus TaxID=1421 RepID=UPI003D0037C1